MTKLVVAGHGIYGTAMRESLEMLLGPQEHVSFVDFTKQDDLNSLQKALRAAMEGEVGEVLFACDLSGGTPFRESAILCLERAETWAVGGFNLAALLEIANHLDLPAQELIDLGREASEMSVLQYPERPSAEP